MGLAPFALPRRLRGGGKQAGRRRGPHGEESRGLEGFADAVCGWRPARTGRRGILVPRTAQGGSLEGGQTAEGQHAPTAAPRPAAAPGRHAYLPGAAACALSPAPTRPRACRPPAYLALAQPAGLLRPLYCIGVLGAVVKLKWPQAREKLTWETEGTWVSAKPLLAPHVWQTPEMLVEIETAWSLSGYLLVCFSAGYFIHDTVDIVVSRQARASWEYLVHHIMAMGAFFSGIFWSSFVGGGVLTLLVEVSNIFLTIRMMMKINNAQNLLLYRVNKYVNLVMYFLFRLAPQAYLTWFFLRYVGQGTQGTFLLGILLLLDVMILIYFSRLLRSDFCPERIPKGQHKDKFLTE
ncbi:TLC domain-containing protein 1 isoform X2 [Nycticebus coucang]|uniref:TLC domain-containing protein 1 isoform X2 n=1 Tax=Nycticebus coucang TaxID=9470 RepID=UPI00234CF119|nr:TLC domain-containing protein 1 isoform X2 [Nycticebus coucang]